jgi:hypothetical protein
MIESNHLRKYIKAKITYAQACFHRGEGYYKFYCKDGDGRLYYVGAASDPRAKKIGEVVYIKPKPIKTLLSLQSESFIYEYVTSRGMKIDKKMKLGIR